MVVHTLSYSHRIIKDKEICHVYKFVRVSPQQLTHGEDYLFSVSDSLKPGDIRSYIVSGGEQLLLVAQGDYTMRTLTSGEKANYETSNS